MEAIGNKRKTVKEEDVLNGLGGALRDVDQTITEECLQAVISQRPSETLYEAVLIACALAESDDLGRFQQAAVAPSLAEIAPRPYKASTFAFHMNEFCEEKRGRILEKTGDERNYRYSFADAMMQPYVIIRALDNGKLKKPTLDAPPARIRRSASTSRLHLARVAAAGSMACSRLSLAYR